MVRYVSANWGIVATVAMVLAAMSLVGLVGITHGTELGRAAPQYAGGDALAHNAVPAAHALTVRPANVTPIAVSANITSIWNNTTTIVPPIILNYTLNVTGAPLNPANVSVSLSIMAGTPVATQLSNNSEPVNPGQANYSISLDYYAIGVYSTLPTSNYSFQLWVTAANSSPNLTAASLPGAVTNGSNVGTIATLYVFNPTIAITTAAPLYDTLPITVSWSVGLDAANSGLVNNASNTAVGFEFDLLFASCLSGCPGPFPVYAPAVVGNESVPWNSTGNYTATIDSGFLSAIAYNDGNPPTGSYGIVPYVTMLNSTNTSLPQRTMQAEQDVYFTVNTPAGSILAPGNVTNQTVGTAVYITTYYTGDYVSSAEVSVLNSSGASVFDAGVFSPGNGGHAGAATWIPGAPGTYTIQLEVTSLYQPPVWVNETGVKVSAGTGQSSSISYVNTTNWHNSSVIPGLSPAAGATILLVIGLIIGLIVALALARMMWGPSSMAPAQPWAQKTGGAAANECSVCHQTFPTKEALDEHAKSAHGITST
jgi:hypothetical protein